MRILHLLQQTPLCVCHFQTILKVGQVSISKHLAYLRTRGLVETERHEQWVIYRLPSNPPPELKLQLACLQDCVQLYPTFKGDLIRLDEVRKDCRWVEAMPFAKKPKSCC